MTNDATERLRSYLAAEAPDDIVTDLDEALAAERRATVEQSYEAVESAWSFLVSDGFSPEFEKDERQRIIRLLAEVLKNADAILDAEADR